MSTPIIVILVISGVVATVSLVGLIVYYILGKKNKVSIDTKSNDNKPVKKHMTKEEYQKKKEEKHERKLKRLSELGIKLSKKTSFKEARNGVMVIGVVFDEGGRVYKFDPDTYELKPGDVIKIKDVNNSIRFGAIVVGNVMVSENLIPERFNKVIEVVYRNDQNNI